MQVFVRRGQVWEKKIITDHWSYMDWRMKISIIWELLVIGYLVLLTYSRMQKLVWKSIFATNLNSSKYEEGFDSSDNQMEDIKDDVLYKFCLSFNEMARKEMLGTDRLWLCGIIPSNADIRSAHWKTRQHLGKRIWRWRKECRNYKMLIVLKSCRWLW